MVSSLTSRRLANFRGNRRGLWSFYIFMVLFVLSLFAELIANDKPLLVYYNDRLYFPLFSNVSETVFGGDFESEADFRDSYVLSLIEEKGWLIMPPIRYSYDTINYDLPTPPPNFPDGENLLGTDDQGRDVLARLIYGFRISVLFGLGLTIASVFLSIIIGGLQGYFAGWVDLIGQRLIEIWSGLPILFLLIILSGLVTPNIWWLFLIMLLFSWIPLESVVRAEFLRTRNFEYVKAAKALGVRVPVLLFRHILPNAMVATLTFLPFVLAGAITTLTALDFLGFGLPVGSPSLGELLAQGKANLHEPWLGMIAFTVIALMLSLLIFIGEATRDAFDPRKLPS